jgi:hypothetical protein
MQFVGEVYPRNVLQIRRERLQSFYLEGAATRGYRGFLLHGIHGQNRSR